MTSKATAVHIPRSRSCGREPYMRLAIPSHIPSHEYRTAYETFCSEISEDTGANCGVSSLMVARFSLTLNKNPFPSNSSASYHKPMIENQALLLNILLHRHTLSLPLVIAIQSKASLQEIGRSFQSQTISTQIEQYHQSPSGVVQTTAETLQEHIRDVAIREDLPLITPSSS